MAATLTPDSFIPLVMNVNRRRVLIVGGGEAALIKLRSLVAARARVIVVAPSVVREIDDLVRMGTVRWWKCPFSERHLAGVRLAVAATDDSSVNKTVIRTCRIRGVLVVGSGKEDKSGLNFCASVKRGALCVGLSTSGTVPALSRYLKKKIEETFPPRWAEVTRVMAGLRSEMDKRDLSVSQKKLMWKELLNGPSIDYILSDKVKELRMEVERCFCLLLE
jgi:uroporphyrin-III C-methyltransferase/precorrin-2 dehydrogenase/sirohydrochlorin ferrochelatase